MTATILECPFLHWKDISKSIPDIDLLSQDKSWFTTTPKYSTFRVNTRKHTIEKALCSLQLQLQKEAELTSTNPPRVYVHGSLPDCIVVEPWSKADEVGINEENEEVIIDIPCAISVLRGADVFAPGILGLTASAKEDDKVNIFADIDKKCRRGFIKKFVGRKYYVGYGILKMDRDSLFKNNAKPKGVGVKVIHNLPGIPQIRLPKDYGILQNLPSIVCGHQFSNVNSSVLDMCAAPGNKTTHIASLLGDKGRVTALDKSPKRISRVMALCCDLGLSNVGCYVFDSTKLTQGRRPSEGTENASGPPFLPASFLAVLLDPPCSGLGQRPILNNPITPAELNSFSALQRKLFKNAVEVLAPGGILVYSTCTVTVEENEGMVAWALKTYADLCLVEITPSLGKPGIKTDCLSEEQRLLVNRFGTVQSDSADEDTIGFFIARFVKTN